jgi:hypothetical protein
MVSRRDLITSGSSESRYFVNKANEIPSLDMNNIVNQGVRWVRGSEGGRKEISLVKVDCIESIFVRKR